LTSCTGNILKMMSTDDVDMSLTPAELEFLAEDTIITIVPSFSMKTVTFFGGKFGPFQPPAPCAVPLWLALHLKKRQKCKIVPPDWMDAELLATRLDAEKQNERTFEKLDFHYAEIASLLLNGAKDDIPNASKVQQLLKDIQDERLLKIRKGLLSITTQTEAVKLNNVAALEIMFIRPILLPALDKFYMLSPKDIDIPLVGNTYQTPVRSRESVLPAQGKGSAPRTQAEPRRQLRRTTIAPLPQNVLREKNGKAPASPSSPDPITLQNKLSSRFSGPAVASPSQSTPVHKR